MYRERKARESNRNMLIFGEIIVTGVSHFKYLGNNIRLELIKKV